MFIWERLGTRLGLQFYELERIRVECNLDNERATRKMFHKWQTTKSSEATPEVLIKELEDLNYRAVATYVREKLEEMQTTHRSS